MRLRATLVICGLVLAVIVAFAAAAYQEMRSSALATAGDRVAQSATELSTMLGTSAAQMTDEVAEIASDPAVVAFLQGDSAEVDSAIAAMGSPNDEGNVVATEIRDGEGRRLLVEGEDSILQDRLDPDLLGLAAAAPGVGVGPLVEVGDSAVYAAISRAEGADGTLGYVVRWRRLATSEENRNRVEALISPGAALYLANTRGDVWTDLGERLVPLPVQPGAMTTGFARYDDPGVGEALIAGAQVPGTAWTVLVGLPLEIVLAGPRSAMQWLILFAAILLGVAGAIAWLLMGRVTGSVAALASAARAITTGEYSRRTPVMGEDEIGTLGRAFNTMAESVERAHTALEQKVVELASTQAQTRATRERLGHLIASSRAIIYSLRVADGPIQLDWISDNVEWLLGYTVAEAYEPGWWTENLDPEFRHRFANHLENGDEGEITKEYRFRHADGSYRWIRDEQRVLRDADGNPVEVIGTLSDVTEHRRLEVAKSAAETASHAKSAFLSRMSHELRTPMNAILGFAQLLDLEVNNERDRESVRQILRGGRHLLQLIDEVLDLSRIEAGQMSLSVEPVAVGETVQESLELVRGMARQRSVTVEVQQGEYFVAADQQRLKQVLLNLLSNAIKYNRPGGSVRIAYDESSAGILRISIADTGVGISEGAMERMFTPFERLDADRTGIEGTGLGLSLSKGLVEAMSGQMGVTSRPGHGSTFWVELPQAATLQPDHSAPADRGVRSQFDGGGRTIVYIEDNLSNVQLVERLFQRHSNIRLIAAMQGRIGLDLAREHRPDLILLDAHLPDISGLQVLAELGDDAALRHVPVVVISADATPAQVARFLDEGAREYLTKPFDVEKLMSVVASELDLGPGRIRAE
ncbi:MAG: ATP-binding protein [Gemmatimonadota bacterium]